jgi:hypothetical protein
VGASHVPIGNTADVIGNKPSAALVSTTSPVTTVVFIRVNGPGRDVEECTSSTLHRTIERRTTPWPECGMSRRDQISVITPTDIILAETWVVEGTDASDTTRRMKTVFSFQSLLNGDSYEDRPPPATLAISGDCTRYPMQPLREDHMIVFCENCNSPMILLELPATKSLEDSLPF